MSTLNENVGLVAGFFGAFYGDKLAIIIAIAILSVMFLGYLSFLRESPFFYYRKGKSMEAEASLKYYWNFKTYTNFREEDDFTDYKDNLKRKWDSGMYQYSIAGTSSAFTRGESFCIFSDSDGLLVWGFGLEMLRRHTTYKLDSAMCI